MTGGYHLPVDNSPSALEIDGTGFDLAKIGSAAHPGGSSPLSGSLSLQSKWQGVETGRLSGEGDAQISNGKLSGVSALHEVARVLQSPALADPELTSVKVHFQVDNGTTRFSGLDIESPVFSITGEGVIDPQGALNASLSLSLHSGAMGGIGGIAASIVSRGGIDSAARQRHRFRSAHQHQRQHSQSRAEGGKGGRPGAEPFPALGAISSSAARFLLPPGAVGGRDLARIEARRSPGTHTNAPPAPLAATASNCSAEVLTISSTSLALLQPALPPVMTFHARHDVHAGAPRPE